MENTYKDNPSGVKATVWNLGYSSGRKEQAEKDRAESDKAVFLAVNDFYRQAHDKLCDQQCRYSHLECSDCWVDDRLDEIVNKMGVQIVPLADLEEAAKSSRKYAIEAILEAEKRGARELAIELQKTVNAIWVNCSERSPRWRTVVIQIEELQAKLKSLEER